MPDQSPPISWLNAIWKVFRHDADKAADIVALVEAPKLGHDSFPSHGSGSGLNDPLHASLMGLDAGAAGGISYRVDLIPFFQHIQGRKDEADLGP